MASLRNKTISGVFWSALESGGKYFIQFGVTVFLARLLTPTDFGTVEMLIIFTALSRVILDSGFSQAIIREKEVDSVDLSSVFYFNVLISILIYGVLFFGAPFISKFYQHPDLTLISRILFISVIINSFGIIHTAKLMKELKFKILTRTSILGAFLSGILGIGFALFGFGVWALVVQTISFSFFNVLFLWQYNDWKPILAFKFSSIKKFFGLSSKLLIVGVLDVLFVNIQSLLIGKIYNQGQLGFYSQAKRFQSIPSNTLTLVIKKVSFPVLSQIQDNPSKLITTYKKVIGTTNFLVIPLMLFLIVVADKLFLVVLTEKWLPAVEFFRPLCLVGLMFPLYSINLNIFTVTNKGSLFLKIGIIKRIVILISVVLTVQHSVIALVWGQVIATLINTIITMIYSGKIIQYRMNEQIQDIIPILLLGLFLSVFTMSIDFILTEKLSPILVLLIQSLTGMVLYFSFAALFKLRSFEEFSLLYSSHLKPRILKHIH